MKAPSRPSRTEPNAWITVGRWRFRAGFSERAPLGALTEPRRHLELFDAFRPAAFEPIVDAGFGVITDGVSLSTNNCRSGQACSMVGRLYRSGCVDALRRLEPSERPLASHCCNRDAGDAVLSPQRDRHLGTQQADKTCRAPSADRAGTERQETSCSPSRSSWRRSPIRAIFRCCSSVGSVEAAASAPDPCRSRPLPSPRTTKLRIDRCAFGTDIQCA